MTASYRPSRTPHATPPRREGSHAGRTLTARAQQPLTHPLTTLTHHDPSRFPPAYKAGERESETPPRRPLGDERDLAMSGNVAWSSACRLVTSL